MAFCTNCGATIPEGVAFCTNCGKPLAAAPRTNPGPAAPVYAYAGAPAPAVKKKKTGLILGIIAAVVLIGAILGILFLTGILGGSKLPTGTWTLQYSSNPNLEPGSNTLMIDKAGNGYIRRSVKNEDAGSTFYHYSKLTCTESVLLIGDHTATYTREGDKLTLMMDGVMFVYNRSGDAEKHSSPKPGMYTLVSATWRGEKADMSDYYEMSIQINDSAICTLIEGSTSEPLILGDYFMTIDGDSYFYSYDGTNITITFYPRTATFTRIG